MKVTSTALIGALLVTSAVHAQTAAPNTSAPAVPASAPIATPMPATIAPIVAGAVDANVLRIGTKVPLRLSEELTTKGKRLRVGQRFNMEVAEAVMVNGQVVIPAGSPAVGEITEVRNKGMWGKSGHLTAQMLHVSVNGRPIRMSGTFDDKGVTGTAGVVGAAVLIPVAGFFMTGTSARIPMGAAVTGFIAEDVPIAFSAPSAGPAPLTVAVPPQGTAPTSNPN